jgi:sulfide:quinone oxidoreductase
MTARPRRIVVAGGGPGGVEAALALQALAAGLVDVEVISAASSFSYRPWAVTEPFGIGHALRVDLTRVAAEAGFHLSTGHVEAVRPADRVLVTDHGPRPYDALVLALGARPLPAVAGAVLFRGPRDSDRLRIALEERCGGPGARAGFVVPAGPVWPLPAYELALLTRHWAQEAGRDLAVDLITAEPAPMHAFGEAASADVAALLAEHGIELHTGASAVAVRGGCVHLEHGAPRHASLAVALPRLQGTPLPGVPQDEHGFVPVDGLCRVRGLDGVYAIGDLAARPVKQGGLATQQADVTAAHIAAAAGATVTVEPYRPVLRTMLLTGGTPHFLRHPAVDEGELIVEGGHDAPWWPAHKIVGRHLGPFLATHADALVAA